MRDSATLLEEFVKTSGDITLEFSYENGYLWCRDPYTGIGQGCNTDFALAINGVVDQVRRNRGDRKEVLRYNS